MKKLFLLSVDSVKSSYCRNHGVFIFRIVLQRCGRRVDKFVHKGSGHIFNRFFLFFPNSRNPLQEFIKLFFFNLLRLLSQGDDSRNRIKRGQPFLKGLYLFLNNLLRLLCLFLPLKDICIDNSLKVIDIIEIYIIQIVDLRVDIPRDRDIE